MLATASLTGPDKGLLFFALVLLSACIVMAVIAAYGLLPGWKPLMIFSLILFACAAEALADGAIDAANVHPRQLAWASWTSLAMLIVAGGAILRWRKRFDALESSNPPVVIALLAFSVGQTLVAGVLFSQILAILK